LFPHAEAGQFESATSAVSFGMALIHVHQGDASDPAWPTQKYGEEVPLQRARHPSIETSVVVVLSVTLESSAPVEVRE